MRVSEQPPQPKDVFKASLARAFAVTAKGYSPRIVELSRPIRYLKNLRLVARLKAESYTMLSAQRGRNLIELARRVERESIPGAIVDCGVWNGGSTVLMGMGAPTRQVWAFDSFEGLPKPGPRDPDAHPDWEGMNRTSEEVLAEGFGRYAGDSGRLHIVKGWFEDTLSAASAEIGEIALLHIDADWYDSVMLALEVFYGNVAADGFVAVDDLKSWQGAKGATAEFRGRHHVQESIRSDHYWRKR